MVARDILPALAFMHERLGLAHRDIKPNNILYADDVASGTLRFRLADFGLARFVRRPGPSQKLSTSTRQKKRRPPAAPTDDSVAVTSARSAGTTARKAKDADRRTQSAPPDLRPSTTADDSAVIDLASFATHFTANVVTHIYKPPEILLHYNTRNAMKDGLVYDCAVDMWSFGIVIMEVLAGGHLTPTEPEETLVRRVRAVFRLDGPRRPHLIRDLVWGMASRAALGRSGISSISRTAPVTETGDDDGAHGDLYVDLIDLVERLLCVDPEQRISATNALAHAFVVGSRRPSRQSALVTSPTSAAATTMMGKAQATTKTKSQSDDTITPTDDVKEDDKNHNTDHLQVDAMEGYRKGTGPAHDGGVDDGAHDLEPKFLAPCAYRALAKGTHGVDQRPCIRTPSSKSLTLAARRVAVKRACIFAQRHGLGTYTVASAVAMLDQCIEMGRVSDDETLLVTMAGALLVACCLYECHWPAHDQFALMGVVPTLWYGLEQRPPSIGVRTPPADAPLRAAVSLFSALGHLTPQPAPLSALIDGSLALAIERKDTNPWRAMTATFSRYPPSTVRLRR
jgi:serine/threonine protein kinase